MGLMDSLSSPYMGTMGLGLLAAGQPQPPGVNRYSYLMQAMQQAQQNQMQQELFKMKKEEYESEKKQRMAQQGALSELVGGPDPKTGITWNEGRKGLTPDQQTSALVRAGYGDQVVGSMFQKPAPPSSLMKEADALFPKGSPEWRDYIVKGRQRAQNETTVNVNNANYPKIPGYAYKIDPATGKPMTDENGVPVLAPVPGGPAALEAEEKARMEEDRNKGKRTETGVLLEDIDRAVGWANEGDFGGLIPTTGFFGQILEGVGGTNAHNLKTKLITIKAGIGFNKLQRMRAESPTGGALGQVSERENELLQSVYGSLAQSQTKEEFVYNMKRLKGILLETIHGPYDEMKEIDGKTYLLIGGKWYET